MKQGIRVLFNANAVLKFVQGEDRQIDITLRDLDSELPVNLTGAQVGVNFPLQGGGSVKRSTLGPTIVSGEVVVPNSSSPGYINLKDHGLVTGDPVELVIISGGLPAPLAVATNYLIQVIDTDNFYVCNSSGVVIPLTTQGSGSFNLVNSTDLSVPSGDLGQISLNLRAAVSEVVNVGYAQDFQLQYTIGGEMRILVLKDVLDCILQPVA